jgi:hypothetical protein
LEHPGSDRNLTATGCLSLSFCLPLRELELNKSVVLSLPVPRCPYLSVKENDYEQRRSQVHQIPNNLCVGCNLGWEKELLRRALAQGPDYRCTKSVGRV